MGNLFQGTFFRTIYLGKGAFLNTMLSNNY